MPSPSLCPRARWGEAEPGTLPPPPVVSTAEQQAEHALRIARPTHSTPRGHPGGHCETRTALASWVNPDVRIHRYLTPGFTHEATNSTVEMYGDTCTLTFALPGHDQDRWGYRIVDLPTFRSGFTPTPSPHKLAGYAWINLWPPPRWNPDTAIDGVMWFGPAGATTRASAVDPLPRR